MSNPPTLSTRFSLLHRAETRKACQILRAPVFVGHGCYWRGPRRVGRQAYRVSAAGGRHRATRQLPSLGKASLGVAPSSGPGHSRRGRRCRLRTASRCSSQLVYPRARPGVDTPAVGVDSPEQLGAQASWSTGYIPGPR